MRFSKTCIQCQRNTLHFFAVRRLLYKNQLYEYTAPRRPSDASAAAAAVPDEDTIVDGTEGGGERERERGESPMGILNGKRDAIIILSAAGVFKN